ncbi:Aste57867_17876 [Aphanomyces stellatus]|uniref:Aste57867_17876 protein n=1 Tax=Aphanomyces stellatus TaxID=120398 RepID=A0A485LAB5_9STRA|nr:hypothetical protein As57867_017815 [Aphanomyces stellatus]VFT94619.1 Aste57867_17876 [Aphanomyces stellatus]
MDATTYTTPRTIPRAENVFSFMPTRIKTEVQHALPKAKTPLRLSKTHKTCLYRTGKCNMPRHVKANGSLHKMCTFHRSKANENQRRLDQKKKDAGFHRRERISAFKVKGVLQPKHTVLHHRDECDSAPRSPSSVPQLQPFEDILPDVMIPFLLDNYTDVTEDTAAALAAASAAMTFHAL